MASPVQRLTRPLTQPLAVALVKGEDLGITSARPSAPLLSLDSEIAGLVSLRWAIDNSIGAGDSLRRQVQVAGGNWSSLLDDTTHVITSPEDTVDQISASLTLPNGTYDIRGFAIKSGGATSSPSNTLTISISDAATDRLMWGADQFLWSTDRLTWA